MPKTKEEIYDQQINPLMAKIIKICQKHKIAFVASFSMPTEEDEGLACTSALLEDEYDPPTEYLDALAILRGQPARSPLMITTRDASGNVTRMDAVL